MGPSGPRGSQEADGAVRGLEARGVVPTEVLPETDEALAKAAIHALAVIALGPMNGQRDKAKALDIPLSVTKVKPAQKVEAKQDRSRNGLSRCSSTRQAPNSA